MEEMEFSFIIRDDDDDKKPKQDNGLGNEFSGADDYGGSQFGMGNDKDKESDNKKDPKGKDKNPNFAGDIPKGNKVNSGNKDNKGNRDPQGGRGSPGGGYDDAERPDGYYSYDPNETKGSNTPNTDDINHDLGNEFGGTEQYGGGQHNMVDDDEDDDEDDEDDEDNEDGGNKKSNKDNQNPEGGAPGEPGGENPENPDEAENPEGDAENNGENKDGQQNQDGEHQDGGGDSAEAGSGGDDKKNDNPVTFAELVKEWAKWAALAPLKAMISTLNKMVAGFLTGVTAGFHWLLGIFKWKYFTDPIGGLLELLDGIIAAVLAGVKQLIESILNVFQSTFKKIRELANKFSPKNLRDMAQKAYASGKAKLGNAGRNVRAAFSKDGRKKAWGAVGDAYKNRVAQAKGGIRDAWGAAKKGAGAVGRGAAAVGRGALAAPGAMWRGAGDLRRGIGSGIRKGWQNLGEGSRKAVKAAGRGLDAAGKTLRNAPGSIGKGLKDFGAGVADAARGIGSGIGDAWSSGKGAMQKGWQSAKDRFKAGPPGLKKAGEGIQKAKENAKNAGKEIKEGFKGGPPETDGGWGTDAYKGLGDKFKGALDNFKPNEGLAESKKRMEEASKFSSTREELGGLDGASSGTGGSDSSVKSNIEIENADGSAGEITVKPKN